MVNAKNRLGRGLDSLIHIEASHPKVKTLSPEISKNFQEIPVELISPNIYQPRHAISEDSLQELVESIRSEGLLQPIVVRRKNNAYEIIAGERRWRACRLLGKKKIFAHLLDASDRSSAVLALVENLQREGLDPIEEALGYRSLMSDFDLTQEVVAKRVGKGRASIANRLRLLQLEEEIQGYIAKGWLSAGHAKVLLSVEEPAERLLLAKQIIKTQMSVRSTERKAHALKSKKGVSRVSSEASVLQDVEKQIATYLQTRVSIKHTSKKGKITIEYFGTDDLSRVLGKMGLS